MPARQFIGAVVAPVHRGAVLNGEPAESLAARGVNGGVLLPSSVCACPSTLCANPSIAGTLNGNQTGRPFVVNLIEHHQLGEAMAKIMSIRTVIIPAAGKGTRLLPATRVTAKELLPIYDRVAIDFAIEEAAGAGVERIIVVISTTKTAIQSYLSQHDTASAYQLSKAGSRPHGSGPEVIFVFQDEPLGLGHAVLCCKGMVLPGPFAVLLPDDIIMGPNCLADMTQRYTSGHMIAAMQVKASETSLYGIFRVSGLPKDRCIPVSGMVEKPGPGTAPSSFAAVGRYILDPMIFDVLEHTPFGKGGELQLTDAIAIAAHALPVAAFQFLGTRHDCGNHDGLLGASVARQAHVKQEKAARTATGLLCVTAANSVSVTLAPLNLTARAVADSAFAP